MLSSPFGTQVSETLVPENCDIVFVADMFVEDYVGGGELTSEALIQACPLNVFKLHSKDVTMKTLESGHKKYWIFGNFSGMDIQLIPTAVANLNYSILEYDYKFCKYRSVEKHLEIEQKECDCHEQMHGKLMSAFFYGAKSLWFMSEKQQSRYFERFPFLKERENWVLSSVFDDQFFITVKLLREKYKDQTRQGWLVVGSQSWIKGTSAGVKWCKENNKDFKLIQDWPYAKVLEEMAQAEGLVYLPLGGDTCPRVTIEAKLLGCELVLNNNVQHKDEEWFSIDEMFDTEAYLFAARDKFWNSISLTMEWSPKLSGYTTTKNCIESKYPWKQAVQSMLEFCDEVVVVDGGSEDGTWEELENWASDNSKLIAIKNARNWSDKRFAVYDGLQKAVARSHCTGDFCWQMDADEVVHENDYQNILNLVKNFPRQADLVSLPVIEYWGGADKIRVDVNPWKWRLSRNLPHITHGIPNDLRKTDSDGNLYASPGTDGCDYINAETFERIPHASFYTEQVHAARMSALSGNPGAMKDYSTWFNSLIESLPGVHHYSWFDISRKILTYKNYWQQHWESLYDIKQDDSPENNMFFQKSWSAVTEEEILEMSSRLADEMGGWIFHSPVDFDKPTPHLVIERSQPKIMLK
jgi:glycosyltransferase involved in cell wall biosynthesis